METMGLFELIYGILGGLICHQMPSRTLTSSGMLLPLCARDTGIYLGILVTTVFLFLKNRFNSDKPPGISYSLVLCVLMIPMLADGISSYLGFRDSNNVLRLVTGIYFGSSLMFFIIPAANFKIEEKNKRAILSDWRDILFIAAINTAICVVILKTDFLPWLLVSSCIIFSFIFLTSRIIYTVLVRTRFINLKCRWLYVTFFTAIVLMFMYLVSFGVLKSRII